MQDILSRSPHEKFRRTKNFLLNDSHSNEVSDAKLVYMKNRLSANALRE